jgi:hypothetical protein
MGVNVMEERIKKIICNQAGAEVVKVLEGGMKPMMKIIYLYSKQGLGLE